MWRKVAEPTVRHKNLDWGRRGKVSAVGGERTAFVGAVGVDYDTKEFLIWLENFPQGLRLPWLDADPDGFDAFVHLLPNGERRLKIWCANWRGDTAQELVLYDTGYSYFD